MRILSRVTVGLVFFLMVFRNYVLSTNSPLACFHWPFCNMAVTPLMETVFLMVALLVFSSLIAVSTVFNFGKPVDSNTPAKIKRLALAGLFGLVVQFVLGSQMRHLGAGLACPNFPNCLEGFLPSPWNYETAIAFAHRWWGFLLLGHFFHLAFAAAKTAPELASPTRRAFALSVAQVFLGIGTVLSGLNADSRVLHAAVGYALWGTLVYVVIRAGGARWLWSPFMAGSSIPVSQNHQSPKTP